MDLFNSLLAAKKKIESNSSKPLIMRCWHLIVENPPPVAGTVCGVQVCKRCLDAIKLELESKTIERKTTE